MDFLFGQNDAVFIHLNIDYRHLNGNESHRTADHVYRVHQARCQSATNAIKILCCLSIHTEMRDVVAAE